MPGSRRIGLIVLPVLFAVLTSCRHIPSPEQRQTDAEVLAQRQAWHSSRLETGSFDLVAFVPDRLEARSTIKVYIEGDGFAWVNSDQASLDPTPLDPVGLRLALADPDGDALYLARPCQYRTRHDPACSARYWTDARFAPEVIEAISRAIDSLKTQAHAEALILVGYSGGAAVAALVAAQRRDVQLLITVAGNLDHRAWARWHGLSPLEASLNPSDVTDRLARVSQVHFVGDRDTVIPPRLAEEFSSRFPSTSRPLVVHESGFDHRCCWSEHWARLLPIAMEHAQRSPN